MLVRQKFNNGNKTMEANNIIAKEISIRETGNLIIKLESEKQAEILLRMVKKALKRRIVKSFITISITCEVPYFLFSTDEFDCEKLGNMISNADGVITQEILSECKQAKLPRYKIIDAGIKIVMWD